MRRVNLNAASVGEIAIKSRLAGIGMDPLDRAAAASGFEALPTPCRQG